MNNHTALVRSIIGSPQLKMLGVHLAKRGSGVFELAPSRWFHGNEKGTPDIEVMLPVGRGRVLWLEVKTGGGKLSKNQVAWRMMAKRLGHKVVIVRSVQDAADAVEEALLEGAK